MSSEQSVNADIIKHRVYLQRQVQAAKTEGFLLFTWMGLVSCLAWSTGAGYGVVDVLGLVPPPDNLDLVFVEGLGATVVGGTAMIVLKPGTAILRRLMVAHPDSSTTNEQRKSHPSEATISHLSTAMGAFAVACVVLGIPSTTFVVQETITTGIVRMGAVLSGYSFWLLATGCFIQAHRTLKHHAR
jgi:hypothetical protein